MNADTPKRKNLGRGLSALFGEQDDMSVAAGDGTAAPQSGAAPALSSVTRLPLDLMNPSPLQPRRHFDEDALNELAISIKEKGVLQPLLVRPDPTAPGHYEIIAGERRWRASQRANVHEVPAHVMELTDSEVLEVALIENLQRQDLSAVEEARGYKRLMEEFGHTQERLADIVGRSRAHVANMLRLLTLPHTVLMLLDDRKLTVGQVRPLIGHKAAETLAQQVLKRGLSARQAEKLAKGYGRMRKQQGETLPKDADTAALEKSLEQATGYKVAIKFDGKGGSVTVGYNSLEQLDDIVKRLSSGGRPKKPERDEGTMDLEEIISKAAGSFPAGKDDDSADDDVHADFAADDVGATGQINRG